MTGGTELPPAGWYDDPADPGRQRYWDGSAWTTETRSGLAELPPPVAGRRRSAGTFNGFAIASLVFGIVWLYGIGSVLAIVFGHVALGQIRTTGQRGRGLAIAGLVLGYAVLGLFVLGLIAYANR